MKNCGQTGLEFSYFSLLKLHDVKIRKISDETFYQTRHHYYFESLVNLSFFYVQMTNKLHYYKLKMRKYLLPT